MELLINKTLHLKYGKIESDIYCHPYPESKIGNEVIYTMSFKGYDLTPGIDEKYKETHYRVNKLNDNETFGQVMSAWLHAVKHLEQGKHNEASIKAILGL